MNSFDRTIILFFNTFAQRSEMLDHVASFLTHNVLVIGGVPMALFWYAWFLYGTSDCKKREILLFGIFNSVFALFTARVLALSLPFRLRPFFNADLHFVLPFGVDRNALIGWSAFPSDRATLFFCLATTLFLVSKRLGMLAYFHAFFIICLPTIYTGIHHPTDFIAGALLGTSIACLSKLCVFRIRMVRPLLDLFNRKPAYFYLALFLCTFEIAELFGSVRSIVVHALQFAKFRV